MAQYWNSSVNTKIRRDGTAWGEVEGFISDKTKSGKPKRRMAVSLAKRPFTVKMIFSYDEYVIFSDWYKQTLQYGTLSFMFPKIDSIDNTLVEYQFAQGGSPQYSNISGGLIECTMGWQEV